MNLFELIFGSYLIGSLPFGLWLTLLITGKDIREFGSGNIGATNVWRTFGWKLGLPVFVLDIAKGLAPVVTVRNLLSLGHIAEGDISGSIIVVTGLAAIIGHNSSIFLKFKGGKGVATSLGVAVGMSWKAGIAGFIVWAIVLASTHYMSLASLVSVPVGSVSIWYFNGQTLPFAVFGIIATVFSFIKHKANIQRLRTGTELKFGGKKEPHAGDANE